MSAPLWNIRKNGKGISKKKPMTYKKAKPILARVHSDKLNLYASQNLFNIFKIRFFLLSDVYCSVKMGQNISLWRIRWSDIFYPFYCVISSSNDAIDLHCIQEFSSSIAFTEPRRAGYTRHLLPLQRHGGLEQSTQQRILLWKIFCLIETSVTARHEPIPNYPGIIIINRRDSIYNNRNDSHQPTHETDPVEY